MKKIFLFLILIYSNSFAFWQLFYSPADYINRTFYGADLANVHFSGNYKYLNSGFLISSKGNLYFDYVDAGYQDIFTEAGDDLNTDIYVGKFFYENMGIYVPVNSLPQSDDYITTLIPDGVQYGSVFADNAIISEKYSVGILMTFSEPFTLGDVDGEDLSCVFPLAVFAEDATGHTPYTYMANGDGTTVYTAPLMYNQMSDSCTINKRTYTPVPEKRVQNISFRFLHKVRDACPDNHYFRASENPNESITCVACPSGTFVDIFENTCLSSSDIENIKNPYSYAKAQCQSRGLSFSHTRFSLNISNGDASSFCETVCSDGTIIENFNCPEDLDFRSTHFEPECVSGDCSSNSDEISSSMENTSSGYYDEGTVEKGEEVEVSQNEDGEVCVGNNCFDIDGVEVNENNEICVDGHCSTISSSGSGGSGGSLGGYHSTICFDGDCYNIDNGYVNGNNQICIDGVCSDVIGGNTDTGGDTDTGGSGGDNNTTIPGGDGDGNGDTDTGGSGGDNNTTIPGGDGDGNGDTDTGGSEDGVCEGGECGEYDNSELNSYFDTMTSLINDLGSFKDNLLQSFENFKESAENTKTVIESGFLNFSNSSFVSSCPLSFDFDYGNGTTDLIKIDFCEFLSSFSNLFYLIFYVIFFVLCIRFSYKIFKDVFDSIISGSRI